MKSISLILAFVMGASSSIAAAAEPKIYVRSNGQFVANGNEYARGLWIPAIQNADDVFKGDAMALEEYHQHQAAATWFGILNWGAVGVLLTYVLVSSSNDNYNNSLGLTIFVIPWLGGLWMGAKSNRHLLKAINLVNGVPAEQAQYRARHLSTEAEAERCNLAKPVEIPVLAWTF